MTSTYDTSNFLPCPFCGAKPEAMDWPGGPMAKVFIHCPNGNYDDEHGGCSVGPDVVGRDMEDAAARWNRRAQVPEGYVAIGKSNLITRREYGETASEAAEKMEQAGFYTYEIKELRII